MRKEFYHVDVQKFLKKHDVNQYSTYSTSKASVVERFSHAQKRYVEDIYSTAITSGSSCRVSDYNARKHRTIGMQPVDVTPAIAERFLDTVYSMIKIVGPAKFKIGDSVRVSKYKMVFGKSYTPN
ncbi:PREDICTED: uncharacterized protein LOC105151379 [Acromyrmex echinatior]|uniref:uncharacterized protein LOC105151379 n=1 Tax=Acromyrmex echinatior TaxID=103372 RepID=UPI000580D96D|nr:PREDICTED: uncharacterized protein LOC105151379 [Acromyrmex echinatior]